MNVASAELPHAPDDDELTEALRCYLLSIAEQSLEPSLRAKIGASDLVQLTFLHARRFQDSYSGDTPEQYRAWLRTTLLRILANMRRSLRDCQARCLDREVPLLFAQNVPASDDDSPSKVVGRDEQEQRLRAVTAQLSAEHQQVLALRFEQNYSFAEIGQRMGGRSEDAARMLFNRAVDHLRTLLDLPAG